MLNELPEHLRPLILCLYRTGVRIGEARQLTWEQVDFAMGAHGVIWMSPEQAKNNTARALPLTAELAMLLEQTPKQERSGLLLDTSNLRHAWEQACDRSGEGKLTAAKNGSPSKGHYKGLIIHDLPRSACRNLRKAGVPEGIVMKISGHKTRSVFERYNITDVQDQLSRCKD